MFSTEAGLVGVRRRKNLAARLVLLAYFSVPLFYLGTFYEHFHAYLTGNVVNNILRDQWGIVVLSILLFLAFLIPLSFRRRAKWAEYGLVTAFFVSLFVEMYGIPFTLLFAQKWLYQSDAVLPEQVFEFDLFGVGFGMDLPMLWAAGLMILGTVIVAVGWGTLYFGVKKQELVTRGIYSYSRHPQYLGFLMVIIGWLIGWPTIITLVFAPILVYKYVRACTSEEREVAEVEDYQRYRERTPFLI
jgi:protein-S-isoprenylcysteine O-methyltransferase Ste14